MSVRDVLAKFGDSQVRQIGMGVSAAVLLVGIGAVVVPKHHQAVAQINASVAAAGVAGEQAARQGGAPRVFGEDRAANALRDTLGRLDAHLGAKQAPSEARTRKGSDMEEARREVAERLGMAIPDLTGRAPAGQVPLLFVSEGERGEVVRLHTAGSPLPEGRVLVGLTRDGQRPLAAPFFRGEDVTFVRDGGLVTMRAADLASELRAAQSPPAPGR